MQFTIVRWDTVKMLYLREDYTLYVHIVGRGEGHSHLGYDYLSGFSRDESSGSHESTALQIDSGVNGL